MSIISTVDHNYTYFNKTAYKYSRCSFRTTFRRNFKDTVIKNTVGVWIPMLIIVTVYVLMFLKLKQHARVRSAYSSQDPTFQIRRISRTFITVVCVFFICLLPRSIWETYVKYLKITTHNLSHNYRSLNSVTDVTTLLSNINCCLNPVIYTKLHTRLFGSFCWVWGKLNSFMRDMFHCRRKIESEQADIALRRIPTNESNLTPQLN